MIKSKIDRTSNLCKLEFEGSARELTTEFAVITQAMFEKFDSELLLDLIVTAATIANRKQFNKE